MRSEDEPLSGARRDLQTANTALTAATTELARPQAPEQRLHAVILEYERAQAELIRLRTIDDAELVSWMVDGAVGRRPEPSTETLDCERHVAGLARDSQAASVALPPLQADALQAAERVKMASLARTDAQMRAITEAAQAFADGYC